MNISDVLLNGSACHTNGEMNSEMENMDLALNYDNPELMSSEFFDSVMSLEQESLQVRLDDEMFNVFDGDVNLSMNENSSNSNSSFHMEEALSPRSLCSDSDKTSVHTETEEMTTAFNSPEHFDETFLLSLMTQPEQPIVQEPEIQNVTIKSNKLVQPVKGPTKIMIQNPNNRKLIVKQMSTASQIKKITPKPKQQVLRLQTLSGNGRPVYLPLNVKTLKIVNSSELKAEPSTVVSTTTGHSIKRRKISSTMSSVSSLSSVSEPILEEDETDVVSSTDSQYPALHLTNEEKRLLAKEGIQLPTHYPLTKNEERELKRIRRKIRNKISAQDSRKRKKEYVDGLEERVKRGSEENKYLLQRIKQLQKQNNRLIAQLSKLQSIIFNSTTSKATPTTCLMIVLLSALLVSLPNIRLPNSKEITADQEQQMATRRSLLSSQQATEDDALNMNEFLIFNSRDDINEEDDFGSKFDEIDIDNITEKDLNKFLDEVGLKRTEGGLFEKNCSEKDTLFRKMIDKVKNFLNSHDMDLFGTTGGGGGFKNEKGFVEPDVDDSLSDVEIISSSSS